MHNINKQVPPKAGIQQAWAEVIPDFFSQQQETLNELVKERLVECLAPHEQRLSQLVEMLRHTAADLFQVPYKPPAREIALEIKRRPYWVLNTWNTDLLTILENGRSLCVRNQSKEVCGKIFQAVGVAMPETIQES
jgi:hypothetical protein